VDDDTNLHMTGIDEVRRIAVVPLAPRFEADRRRERDEQHDHDTPPHRAHGVWTLMELVHDPPLCGPRVTLSPVGVRKYGKLAESVRDSPAHDVALASGRVPVNASHPASEPKAIANMSGLAKVLYRMVLPRIVEHRGKENACPMIGRFSRFCNPE
jgi:hypothetical protein